MYRGSLDDAPLSIFLASFLSRQRFDALITIGETPTLGMRGARKHMGGGDSQQARKESHAEERGCEGACAAAGKTECGCSGEDHVL